MRVVSVNSTDRILLRKRRSAILFTSIMLFASYSAIEFGSWEALASTDEDGDDITFTISGEEIEITSGGVLTFVSAPDYETKTSYTATVTASDGTNTTTQDITISINNLMVEKGYGYVYHGGTKKN